VDVDVDGRVRLP